MDFKRFWLFSFGFRPAFLPSRPYLRVCVSVEVFLSTEPPCTLFCWPQQLVGAISLVIRAVSGIIRALSWVISRYKLGRSAPQFCSTYNQTWGPYNPTYGPHNQTYNPHKLPRPTKYVTQYCLSAFRSSLWPDCYRESTEIGPPAGPEGRFTARKHYCVT